MKYFFRKPWIVAVAAIVVAALVVGAVTVAWRVRESAKNQATKVISAAGTVEPADTVDLGFETGGRVVRVTKIIGDKVSAGEVIAEVENADLRAQFNQAEAAVASAKAMLVQLESGTNTAAVAVDQTLISKDTDAITDDSNDLAAVLAEDYSVADDSIHGKVDDFFVNPYSPNPQLAFTDNDPSVSTIESGRVEVENRLTDLRTLTSTTTIATVSDTSSSVNDDLAEIKLFLDNVALAVNALSSDSSGASQPTIDGWKDDLSTARAGINDSITATLAADNKLQSAEDALVVDQQELTADQNADPSIQIASEKAVVDQDEALVGKINAELAKTYIISPIDGVVTRQDARLGQVAVANTNLVSIESVSKYQIAAVVSGSDASRLAIGENADVRLDAYGPNVVFQAVVVGLNPTETNNEETTTLQFDVSDDRIKSGMSADVTIYGSSTTAGNKI